jgi:hypothetical protein
MNILYFDCFAGLSADMNLAAMLDLGVDSDQPRPGVSRPGLGHEFELRVSRDACLGTPLMEVFAGIGRGKP